MLPFKKNKKDREKDGYVEARGDEDAAKRYVFGASEADAEGKSAAMREFDDLMERMERKEEEPSAGSRDYGFVEIPREQEEPQAAALPVPTSRHEALSAALDKLYEEPERADAAPETIADHAPMRPEEGDAGDGGGDKPLFDRGELWRKFNEQLDSIEAEVKDIADYAPTIGVHSFGYVCDAAGIEGLDGSHITFAYNSEHECLCVAEQSLKYLVYKLFGFAPKAIEIESVDTAAASSQEELPIFSRCFAEPLAARFTVRGVRYFTDFKALFRMNDETGEEAVED